MCASESCYSDSYSQSELFPVAVVVTAILTVVIAVVVKVTHCANAGQCLS